jgi:hypothetical protein
MLCLAGTLSRNLYEHEMTQMKNFYTSFDIEEAKRPEKNISKSKKSLYKWLKKRVLNFSFKKHTSIVQMTQYDVEKSLLIVNGWKNGYIVHFTYNSSTS